MNEEVQLKCGQWMQESASRTLKTHAPMNHNQRMPTVLEETTQGSLHENRQRDKEWHEAKLNIHSSQPTSLQLETGPRGNIKLAFYKYIKLKRKTSPLKP